MKYLWVDGNNQPHFGRYRVLSMTTHVVCDMSTTYIVYDMLMSAFDAFDYELKKW
jgi:hypothetical protein